MMPIRNRRRRGFLSTPSARRATGTVDDADFLKVFLSTPSARRATKPAVVDVLSQRFLSTPSARRATAAHVAMQAKLAISIHALREEGDPEGWEDSHHD